VCEEEGGRRKGGEGKVREGEARESEWRSAPHNAKGEETNKIHCLGKAKRIESTRILVSRQESITRRVV